MALGPNQKSVPLKALPAQADKCLLTLRFVVNIVYQSDSQYCQARSRTSLFREPILWPCLASQKMNGPGARIRVFLLPRHVRPPLPLGNDTLQMKFAQALG